MKIFLPAPITTTTLLSEIVSFSVNDDLNMCCPLNNFKIYSAFRSLQHNVNTANFFLNTPDLKDYGLHLYSILNSQVDFLLQGMGYVWGFSLSELCGYKSDATVNGWILSVESVIGRRPAETDAKYIIMENYQQKFNALACAHLPEDCEVDVERERETDTTYVCDAYQFAESKDPVFDFVTKVNILALSPIIRESGVRGVIMNMIHSCNGSPFVEEYPHDFKIELAVKNIKLYGEDEFGFESYTSKEEVDFDIEGADVSERDAFKESLDQFLRKAVLGVAVQLGYKKDPKFKVLDFIMSKYDDGTLPDNIIDLLIEQEELQRKEFEDDLTLFEMTITDRLMSCINRILYEGKFKPNTAYRISHDRMVEMLGGNNPTIGSESTKMLTFMVASAVGVSPSHVNLTLGEDLVFIYLDASLDEVVDL